MPEYTSEQKRVIAHRDGNLLVSAAAGSGKTAVLVERILALVREGADIASFLIVTFTRAAADELRQRLMSSLEAAAEEDESLQEQVGRVELASISTIHAFCLQLIGRYFEKAGAEPNARTCTEAERIILQMRAMDKVLDEMYADEETLAVLEKMGDPEQVRFNAESLYKFLMCQPDPLGWLEKSLKQYSAEMGHLSETDWFADAQETEGAGMMLALAYVRDAVRFCQNSHADDCSIVYVPEEKLVFLGDITCDDLHHTPRCIHLSRYESLRRSLTSLDFTHALEGHYENLCTRAEIFAAMDETQAETDAILP